MTSTLKTENEVHVHEIEDENIRVNLGSKMGFFKENIKIVKACHFTLRICHVTLS